MKKVPMKIGTFFVLERLQGVDILPIVTICLRTYHFHCQNVCILFSVMLNS